MPGLAGRSDISGAVHLRPLARAIHGDGGGRASVDARARLRINSGRIGRRPPPLKESGITHRPGRLGVPDVQIRQDGGDVTHRRDLESMRDLPFNYDALTPDSGKPEMVQSPPVFIDTEVSIVLVGVDPVPGRMPLGRRIGCDVLQNIARIHRAPPRFPALGVIHVARKRVPDADARRVFEVEFGLHAVQQAVQLGSCRLAIRRIRREPEVKNRRLDVRVGGQSSQAPDLLTQVRSGDSAGFQHIDALVFSLRPVDVEAVAARAG